MKSVVAYVRNLLGWCDENPAIRNSFKRDRVDDDFFDDETSPAIKRLKALKKTSFPDIMDSNDAWEKEEKSNKNVRYVPIQIEPGHPSTSTPYDGRDKLSKLRTFKLVGMSENGPATPSRKPRMHTPVQPIVHHVLDDDEPEVTWVETKPESSKKSAKLYINIDDEENAGDADNDEVIFVKKVSTPPPVKPYKYFVTNDDTDVVDSIDNDAVYYRINRRNSPKVFTKFKAPPGITKAYKKAPTPVPKWMQPMQPQRSTNFSQIRNKYLSLNGGLRSTLSEVFNLDEKKSYQELIKRVTASVKPLPARKSVEIINLAEDSASFRNTLRSQKQALNDIKFVEKGVLADKENETTKEYDPITVASINSSDSEVEIVPSESSTSSVKIDPVNSLRDSYRYKAVTSDDFLAKLNSKYRKKKIETQEKLNDARRESDIISKVNYEQKLALLENKLKHELSIPESLIEEPQPTVELPKLTPEQEKLVNRALGPGPAGQLLVEKFNLRIHRRDLQTLAGLNWLNDEVINFYMNLLMQRSEERPDLPKVYAANTFFYPKLLQSGQAGLRRWTRKVDIFATDLMVVPVHLGVHWCVCLVDFKAKQVQYLDSMGGRNPQCLSAVMQYLRDEHQDKKGQPFDDNGWKTVCLSQDIPQQMNGSDCGMFTCTFAEFSCRRAPYSFSQQHMPLLRRKMALEILQAKLML